MTSIAQSGAIYQHQAGFAQFHEGSRQVPDLTRETPRQKADPSKNREGEGRPELPRPVQRSIFPTRPAVQALRWIDIPEACHEFLSWNTFSESEPPSCLAVKLQTSPV